MCMFCISKHILRARYCKPAGIDNCAHAECVPYGYVCLACVRYDGSMRIALAMQVLTIMFLRSVQHVATCIQHALSVLYSQLL